MASNYFRKVLALVLALLMVFVFSSCNKQSDNTSSQSDSSQTESASSDVKDTSSETDGASSKIDDASSEAVDSSSKAENTSSENDRTSSVVDNSFNNSSNTVSVPETIVTETGYVFNGVDGSAMFDGRRSTHWFPDTYEKTVIEFSSLEPKTFDALKLVEFDFLLKEFNFAFGVTKIIVFCPKVYRLSVVFITGHNVKWNYCTTKVVNFL